LIADWNGTTVNNSSTPPPDFTEEDDLGFDPFHETQKALAEMLETESKQVQSKTLHMPRLEGQLLSSGGGQIQGPSQAFVQQQQQQNATRAKAPPPGFNLASNMHPSKT
jgi:hypothetical protein